MRTLLASLTLLAAATVFAQPQQPRTGAALSEIKTVYLLPMSNGMDQFLASRLTREGVLLVVADPSKADAILTDHLGAGFEQELKDLYPEPKSAPVAKPDADEVKDAKSNASSEDGDKDSTKDTKDASRVEPDMSVKAIEMSRPLTATRGRGTMFLVKRDTREVLWSAYKTPAVHRGKNQDENAGTLVAELKHAIKHAAKAPAGN